MDISKCDRLKYLCTELPLLECYLYHVRQRPASSQSLRWVHLHEWTTRNQQKNNPPKPQNHEEWLNYYIKSLSYGVICLQQYITDTEFGTRIGEQNLEHVTLLLRLGSGKRLQRQQRNGIVEWVTRNPILETESMVSCTFVVAKQLVNLLSTVTLIYKIFLVNLRIKSDQFPRWMLELSISFF